MVLRSVPTSSWTCSVGNSFMQCECETSKQNTAWGGIRRIMCAVMASMWLAWFFKLFLEVELTGSEEGVSLFWRMCRHHFLCCFNGGFLRCSSLLKSITQNVADPPFFIIAFVKGSVFDMVMSGNYFEAIAADFWAVQTLATWKDESGMKEFADLKWKR